MQPLDSVQRKILLLLSTALCIAPLVLAPIAARPSLRIPNLHAAGGARLQLPEVPLAWTAAPVHFKRDPFVDAGPLQKESAASPDAKAEAVNVRAIVTGAIPRALVESGGIVRMIGEGAPLQGSVVVRIDAAGIHLKNGATLRVNGAGN